MTLPGSMTYGYLEEDIPLKAYFRVKPLFVITSNTLLVVDEPEKVFPDDGGIRIVPDKNESNRFKGRMRTLGKYCMLDLLKHVNENDKIRPNKNYNPENMEMNRSIIYSDVVTRIPSDVLLEVYRLPTVEDTERVRIPDELQPGTDYIMLIIDGVIRGPYRWVISEVDGHIDAVLDPTYKAVSMPELMCANVYRVMLSPGKFVELYVSMDGTPVLHRVAAEAPEEAVETPDELPDLSADEEEVVPDECAAEVLSDIPEIPEVLEIPESTVLLTESEGDAAISEGKSRPQIERPEKSSRHERTERNERSERGERSEAAPFRPETTEGNAKRDREKSGEVTKKLSASSARNALRIAPTREIPPLNPRKSRNFMGVVDELWRKSRLDQLGCPVQVNSAAEPLLNPIEEATQAIQRAWDLATTRDRLVDAVGQMGDFVDTLLEKRAPVTVSRTSEQNESMTQLEAERLQLLRDIDTLRQKRGEAKTELLQEVRADYARELEESEAKCRRAQAAYEAHVRRAAEARDAENEAEHLLEHFISEEFDQRLTEFALHSRAVRLIKNMDTTVLPISKCPPLSEPSAGELISDVRVAMERAGIRLSNDEAVNLLACLTVGQYVLISGETGTGKSDIIRFLADALGLNMPGSRRFMMLDPDVRPVKQTDEYRALTANEDMATLRILMLNDINIIPSIDMTRGIAGMTHENPSSLKYVLTLQDDQYGLPVSPRIYDRGFLVRMPVQRAARPWKRMPITRPTPETAVSLEALQRIFSAKGNVPGEVEDRLMTLLDKLAMFDLGISDRALDDMYAYCAAVLPMMQCTPMDVLDLAIAQRALPRLLATAKLDALHALPELLADMPRCLQLMTAPLPFPAL